MIASSSHERVIDDAGSLMIDTDGPLDFDEGPVSEAAAAACRRYHQAVTAYGVEDC